MPMYNPPLDHDIYNVNPSVVVVEEGEVALQVCMRGTNLEEVS
jgi:hypothetical protein